MSDYYEFDDGRYITIDSDGVHMYEEAGDHLIDINWDQFGELAEWLGYARGHEHDRVQRLLHTLGDAMIDRIGLDGMNPQEIDAVIMEIIGGDHKGSAVVVRTASGEEFVGQILSNHPNPPEMHIGGSGETTYTTPVEVAIGSIDVDSITFTGTHVYEPQTRDYPGYDAIEEVGVEIDGDFQRVEYVEVVG